jgi:Protein of unknown function (DUF992)
MTENWDPQDRKNVICSRAHVRGLPERLMGAALASREREGNMAKLLATFASLIVASIAVGPSAAQQPSSYARSGVLNCTMSPSIGFIIGSHQTVACRFDPHHGVPERYVGALTTLGLDIGITAGSLMGWAVLLSTTDPYPGVLAGTYVGASGDIAVGVGAGANLLIGGSNRAVALQPISIEGPVGIDLTLGVSGLELQFVP